MRSFDPRSVGSLECRAWETYYRRRWGAFLVASVGFVRAAFEMGWRDTLAGAWLVLRANQKWAPFPDNDPAAARRLMTSFYRRLAASEKAGFDPGRAAELEVEWWRAHREAQHDGGGRSPAGGGVVGAASHPYSFTHRGGPGGGGPTGALWAVGNGVSPRPAGA